MTPLIIVLRLLHILSAFVWYGVTFALAAFIAPTAKRLGPASDRFMESIAAESGLPIVMTIAGIFTVIGGLALYSFTSGQFDKTWMRSPTGITFSIGALFGFTALGHGLGVQGANGKRLAKLAREITAGGGTPNAAQSAQLDVLREKLAKGARASATMLTIAAAAMAIARYV